MRLLEREEELRRLRGAVSAAARGRGGLVLVEGPAGIGKTRLLDAARAAARELDAVVLAARASELDRDFPFGVVRQLLEPLVAERPALLRGAAALAAPIVGASPDADVSAMAQLHGLYWVLANLAEDGPALLAVDDLHWADAGSLRFLRFLLPRLEELPVAVVVAARRGEPEADREALAALAADPAAVVLRPAPLTEEAVAALAAESLGEAGAAFSRACREATGGNPFLVRELLREVVPGAAPGGDPLLMPAPLGEAVPGEASPVSRLAPPAVARSVLARSARLGPAAVALARAVAVLGDGTPLRRACAAAGVTGEEGGEAAAALAGADVFAAARPLAFAHPILRAPVYGDVEPGLRAALHRRAADVLLEEGAGADAAGVHLLASEPAGDEAVVAVLRQAAARAVTRAAAPTAVALLRRALAEPPPAAVRGRVLFELASAEVEAGEPVPAAEHFEEAARLTPDPRERAEHARVQALALFAAGAAADAYPLLERAADEVADVDPELGLALEGSLVGIARLDRSRLAWARDRIARHRERLGEPSTGSRMLLATQAHLEAFSPHSRATAVELADVAERALAGGRLLREIDAWAPPFFFALDVLLLADRLDAAREAIDAAVEGGRRRGSAPAFAFAAGVRAGLLAREGRLAEAEAEGRTAADLSLDQGWFHAAPNALGTLIGVLVDRGEMEDAERYLERSGVASDRPRDVLGLERIVHARARLRAAQGDLAAARADLARLGRPRSRWNTYPTLVPHVLIAPSLAGDDAPAAAERSLREARGWGTPRAIGMALHARALAQLGPASAGPPATARVASASLTGAPTAPAAGAGAVGPPLALLAEAAAMLEDSPARLEHARALLDLGSALRRANQRAAARPHLRRALDAAHACGAVPLAERARAELRAAGGRPRRPRTSGADALTASERRIAVMAAGGMSNPEIAQALFVTTKTVEAHLSSAYRKLGIASRAELRDVLGDRRAG